MKQVIKNQITETKRLDRLLLKNGLHFITEEKTFKITTTVHIYKFQIIVAKVEVYKRNNNTSKLNVYPKSKNMAFYIVQSLSVKTLSQNN